MAIAKQIGVREGTRQHRERNKATPVLREMLAIIRFLGYVPFPSGGCLSEPLAACRKVYRPSRKGLASLLQLNESTLAGWETQGHHPAKEFRHVLQAFLESSPKVGPSEGGCRSLGEE